MNGARIVRIVGGVLLACAVGLSLVVAAQFDLRPQIDRLAALPSWLLAAIVASAPLAGVPLSVLLIVLGLALPLAPAVSLVVATLIAHHLLVWRLARGAWSQRLHQALSRRGLLPASRAPRRPGDDLLFILAATWVPGLSYIFKVGLTALAGMSFRTYLVAGVVSQTVAALPYLLLGRVAEDANLGAVGAAIFAVAALLWLLKRGAARVLRPAAADDTKLP